MNINIRFLANTCQDRPDPVFNKGQDVSLCESIHRTDNCDATPQINSYMITITRITIFVHFYTRETNKATFMSIISQGHLDPVFNKGQDVSLCESVHRTSTCFRC